MRPADRSWSKAAAAFHLALLLLLSISCSRPPTGEKPPSTGGAAAPASRIAPLELPGPALEELRTTTLAAYEDARQVLARGRTAGLAQPAERLAKSLETTTGTLQPGALANVRRALAEVEADARSMAVATDLATARDAFGRVSRSLIALAAADPRLVEGWHVYACPMTKTFPKWMQPSAEHENPYMGPSMASCGSETDWALPGPSSPAAPEPATPGPGKAIAYYTCSMHPSVKSQQPGTCPICSMDLVPVTTEEVRTGIIRLDAERRQTIGVKTALAERRSLHTTLRTAGTVAFDETRLADVTVKYRGWIGELMVDELGQKVTRGETLFTLYSPELYTTERELLTALASQRAAHGTSAPHRADYLVSAARERLRLWDLTEQQIDHLAETGEAVRYLPITSPVSGYVIEKSVVAGASVTAGTRLYRIAGLGDVWVEAELDKSELPLVSVGQPVTVSLSYLPGKLFRGRVSYVYPYLDGSTRTGKVRIELPNPGLELKPGMFADVVIERDLGERLVVPEEAVLYAGERSFVFLDLGEGRLKPTAVETGVETHDEVEILSGLQQGDLVVTSGNFLVAAESRLKVAMEQWR